MIIEIPQINRIYENKEQALSELAFCHYPVTVVTDGRVEEFSQFSDIEKRFADCVSQDDKNA